MKGQACTGSRAICVVTVMGSQVFWVIACTLMTDCVVKDHLLETICVPSPIVSPQRMCMVVETSKQVLQWRLVRRGGGGVDAMRTHSHDAQLSRVSGRLLWRRNAWGEPNAGRTRRRPAGISGMFSDKGTAGVTSPRVDSRGRCHIQLNKPRLLCLWSIYLGRRCQEPGMPEWGASLLTGMTGEQAGPEKTLRSSAEFGLCLVGV